MNTVFTLKYRDGANYKNTMNVVVEGELSADQLARLNALSESDDFIPSRVGLPSLSPVLDDSDAAMDAAVAQAESELSAQEIREFDHAYHSLISVESTKAEPDRKGSAQEIYRKIMAEVGKPS